MSSDSPCAAAQSVVMQCCFPFHHRTKSQSTFSVKKVILSHQKMPGLMVQKSSAAYLSSMHLTRPEPRLGMHSLSQQQLLNCGRRPPDHFPRIKGKLLFLRSPFLCLLLSSSNSPVCIFSILSGVLLFCKLLSIPLKLDLTMVFSHSLSIASLNWPGFQQISVFILDGLATALVTGVPAAYQIKCCCQCPAFNTPLADDLSLC
jgi:hypothetical protein